MNQSPYVKGHTLAGAATGLGYYSDLLDDFLDEIRKLESEYMRAMRDRCGGTGAVPVMIGSRALDRTS
ncbi:MULTISPECIES: hypothetical protein [Streptomyces]|uniref:hypothetical protein n=1 Tax=Streptomyces TaxID=1883 RepID=UPI00292D1667|nr:hypothetical protein [Streptomyces sp. NEAU-HV9]